MGTAAFSLPVSHESRSQITSHLQMDPHRRAASPSTHTQTHTVHTHTHLQYTRTVPRHVHIMNTHPQYTHSTHTQVCCAVFHTKSSQRLQMRIDMERATEDQFPSRFIHVKCYSKALIQLALFISLLTSNQTHLVLSVCV